MARPLVLFIEDDPLFAASNVGRFLRDRIDIQLFDKADLDSPSDRRYELAILDQRIADLGEPSRARPTGVGGEPSLPFVFLTASHAEDPAGEGAAAGRLAGDASEWSVELHGFLRRAIESTRSGTPHTTLSAAQQVYEQLLRAAPAGSADTKDSHRVGSSTVIETAQSAAQAILGGANAEVDSTLRAARRAAEADVQEAARKKGPEAKEVGLDEDAIQETNRLLQELLTAVRSEPSRTSFGIAEAIMLATLVVAIATLAVTILTWRDPGHTTQRQSPTEQSPKRAYPPRREPALKPSSDRHLQSGDTGS